MVVSLQRSSSKRALDGTFGFKEFRRDPEDAGGWTLVSDTPGAIFATQEQAPSPPARRRCGMRRSPAKDERRMPLHPKAEQTLESGIAWWTRAT